MSCFEVVRRRFATLLANFKDGDEDVASYGCKEGDESTAFLLLKDRDHGESAPTSLDRVDELEGESRS
jgi:hypothetical protein